VLIQLYNVVTAKAKGPVRAKCLIAIFEDPSNLDMKVYIRNNLHHRGLLYPTDRSSKTDLVKKPKRKVSWLAAATGCNAEIGEKFPVMF
jgi:hypothetical protein